MRLSHLLCKQHIGRTYKFHWQIVRKVQYPKRNHEEMLASMGVSVVDPTHILTPPIDYTPILLPATDPPKVVERQPKELCYMLTNFFRPIEQLNQAQLITNAVVREGFPSSFSERMNDVSSKEEELLKEGVLHSLVYDSAESKLPKYIDIHNRPGIYLPRQYGIPTFKESKSLSLKLLVLLTKAKNGNVKNRRILEDVLSKSTLRHSGYLVHMKHHASYMVTSERPLDCPANSDEVKVTEGEELPDIYPFEPFINVPSKVFYDPLVDSFAINSGCPHTIFVHENIPKHLFRAFPEQFYGQTLINGFSHAFSYARSLYKITSGDLPKPVTVQVIHTNRQKFHLGIFQLNSLDPESRVKNIFWHQPWEDLYDSCGFKSGRPYIEGLNVKLLKDLKTLL